MPPHAFSLAAFPRASPTDIYKEFSHAFSKPAQVCSDSD